MPFYLINQHGRISTVDDITEFERWLKTYGFREATKKEAQSYNDRLRGLVESKHTGEGINTNDLNVQLVTVSQGGKDGYGITSKLMLERLLKVGVKVGLYDRQQKIALLYHNPYSILQLPNEYRVLFTMFESDKIPEDWHDYLGVADLLLVPSKWCQSVFKKAGFDTRVVPLGYDEKIFTFKKRLNKRDTRKDFIFLHYNAFNIRKGFPEVFKAFVKEFGQTEPVKLILKTTLEDTQIPFPISKEQYPNIEVIAEKYSSIKLAELCHRSDCFVYPSRGEGFGIPPLEAMATGMPAIVPNAHGITEYFNNKFMYEVKVKGTCPALYSRYKGQDVGKMVICDEKDLRQRMRWVYEHQNEGLEMGKRASEYVRRWTFERTAENIKSALLDVQKQPPKKKLSENVLQLDKV